jgi:phage tail sheath protein FI
MPEYLSPGVYVDEFETGARPIEGVGTSTAAAFLGHLPKLATGVAIGVVVALILKRAATARRVDP